MINKKILIVGAGFAGAVIARELADAGYVIDVIDERNHIAGNAYDYIHNGTRIHKYGPHIWHTSNDEAQTWISKFTDWIEYKHKVKVLLPNGDIAPLPINTESINKSLNLNLKEDEILNFLDLEKISYEKITNSRQAVESVFGKNLCDIFFAPYTEKMWGYKLEELSASVAARIPMTVKSDPLYFPKDQYQGMPKHGYTAIFENIFNHKNISVKLSTSFNKDYDISQYCHVFSSSPIDVYYDYIYGPLKYRSLKFNHVTLPSYCNLPSPTMNFTTQDKFTRVTSWKQYPGHDLGSNETILTYEEPCDYTENNNERYYPVKDINGEFQEKYLQYKSLSTKDNKITWIGRQGTYQYLDMWMVICQSLKIARDFIK